MKPKRNFLIFWIFFAIFLEFSIMCLVKTKGNDNFYFLAASWFSYRFWIEIERRHHDPVQSVKQEFLRQGGEQAELECRGAGLVQGECPCSKCKDKYKWLLSTPVSISDIRRMVISVYSMPRNSILTRTSSLMGKRPHGSVVRRTFIDRESRTTPLVMNRLRVLANKERWEKWVELSKFDQWALQP